jgi:hypothetical protein
MTATAHSRVFLSASFPSGGRGELVRPYDVAAIADAVTALSRAVLGASWRLVFGAHPTISPLVLMVARELGRPGAVEIYQSEYFAGQVPDETVNLVDDGFGVIRWVPGDPGENRNLSLERMRDTMIETGPYTAALFIGGMNGVVDEYQMIAKRWPEVPRLPLWAPGGAARNLSPSDHPVARLLADQLRSERYPAVAHRIVAELAKVAASNGG